MMYSGVVIKIFHLAATIFIPRYLGQQGDKTQPLGIVASSNSRWVSVDAVKFL
jgi:hypothetical protein